MMKVISRAKFEGFDIPRMMPVEMMPWEEIEFYQQGDFIAAITEDKIDHDFGFVVFTKRGNGEPVFYNNTSSLGSKDEAIKRLNKVLAGV